MIITEIDIRAYGLMKDFRVNGLSPGLNVFLGGNEAGKSTLLAFLKAMLFGFPDRRKNQRGYEPPEPGTYGGKLGISVNKKGDIFIERKRIFDGIRSTKATLKIYGEHEGPLPEGYLQGLLGNVTRDLYENVFGFGLDELQNLESLSSSQIKEAIYGAGFGAAILAIPSTTKRLERDLSALFRPGGHKQEINKVLSELEGLRAKLSRAKDELGEYNKLKRLISSLNVQLAELEKGLVGLETNFQKTNQLLECWPDYLELIKLDSRATKLKSLLGKARPSSEDLSKAAQIQKRLGELSDKKAGISLEIGELESGLLRNRFDERLVSMGEKIQALLSKREHFLNLERQIPLQEQEISELEKQVAQGLRDLGPSWSEDKVLATDTGLSARSSISRFKKEFDGIKKKIFGLLEQKRLRQAGLDEVKGERNDLIKASSRLKEEVKGLSKKGLSEMDASLKEAEGLLRQIRRLDEELLQCRALIAERLKGLFVSRSLDEVLGYDLESLLTKGRKLFIENQQVQNSLSIFGDRLFEAKEDLSQISKGLDTRKKRLSSIYEKTSHFKADPGELSALVKTLSGDLSSMRHLRSSLSSLGLEKKRLIEQTDYLLRKKKYMERAFKASFLIYPVGGVLLGFLYFKGNPYLSLDEGIWYLAPFFLVLSTLPLYLKKKRDVLKDIFQHKNSQLKGIDEEEDSFRQELDAIEKKIEKAAELFHVSKEDCVSSFDRIVKETEGLVALWQEKKMILSQIELLHGDLEEKKRLVYETENRIRALEDQKRLIHQRWQDLLEKKGLSHDLRLDDYERISKVILELSARITRYNELLHEKKALEDKLLKAIDSLTSRYVFFEKEQGEDLGDFLTNLRNRLDAISESLSKALALEERALELKEQEERQALALSNVCDELDKAHKEEERLRAKWVDFLKSKGLEQYLEEGPDVILDLFSRIERLNGLLTKKKQLSLSLSKLRGQEEVATRQIEEVTSLIFPQAHFDGLVHAVDLMVERFNKERARFEQYQRIEDKLSIRRERLTETEREMDALKKELDGIFLRFHVDDLKGFEEKVLKAKDLQEIEGKINELILSVSARLGLDAEKAAVCSTFSKNSLHDLKAQKGELERQRKDVFEKRDLLYKERAEAVQRIKELTSSKRHEELLLRHESLRARLKRLSRKWAVLAISKHLIDKAKERFERENQPAVLSEASSHFSQITEGRYKKVVPDPESGFAVLTKKGVRIRPQRLSRGTAEQLYLCLRFGVISTCEPQGQKIPVMMDDIFVNFDPERMALAAKAVVNFSRQRQVLFFTCHPHIASTLMDISENGKLIQMERLPA